MASVEAGEIKEVTITEGIRYEGTSGADNTRFETIGPEADAAILSRLTDAGVDVRFRPPDSNGPLLTILGQWLPLVGLFVLFLCLLRQVQGAGRRARSFGR